MEDFWAKLVPEIYVSSLSVSLRFYVDQLGFSVKYGREEEGFAYLDRAGAQMMLEEIDPKNRLWMTGELQRPFGRGVNFQIEIEDVDDVYQVLRDRNYPIYLEIEDKWYRTGNVMGGNRQFIVADPDGYLLRFFTSLGDCPIENE